MQRRSYGEESDGIAALLRETADGLGRLIADHVRLAKLELLADARMLVRQASLLLIALPLCVFGYVLLWLGGISALAPLIGRTQAFLLVGGGHLAVGGTALMIAVRRLRRRPRLMDDTVAEVTRTLAAMSSTAAGEPISGQTTRGLSRANAGPAVTGSASL